MDEKLGIRFQKMQKCKIIHIDPPPLSPLRVNFNLTL